MKIQIMGYSGSGKSTLAKQLLTFYHLPLLHMDSVQFYGDWQERTKEEQIHLVKAFMAENDEWIIDGNYTSIVPKRFSESDLTIFLNFNRFYCYDMCLKRYRQHKNQIRGDCPCIEKFDTEFRRWILWDGRTKKRIRQLFINFRKAKGQSLMFRSRKTLNKWLMSQGIPLVND